MTDKYVQGVYTALLTPRDADGSLNRAAFERLLHFQLDAGITGFAVNGATGEFCLTSPKQLDEILTLTRQLCGGRARILCGVGAAGVEESAALLAVAERHKVHGVLLPMPFFFRYEPEDLEAFARAMASRTALPVLLYNLPQFASGLDAATVVRLVKDVPNIIGIKDSSGSLDILRALTSDVPEACRVVGNDGALADGLGECVVDGVVSGVACVLPGLMQRLFGETPGTAAFDQEVQALSAVIQQLDRFPTPWGLKWAAEALGLFSATFAQPITERRLADADSFMRWFAECDSVEPSVETTHV